MNWYRQKESNLYFYVRSVVYYPLYYGDKIGALTPIRTEKTAPFERADFTNLSIGVWCLWKDSNPQIAGLEDLLPIHWQRQ